MTDQQRRIFLTLIAMEDPTRERNCNTEKHPLLSTDFDIAMCEVERFFTYTKLDRRNTEYEILIAAALGWMSKP